MRRFVEAMERYIDGYLTHMGAEEREVLLRLLEIGFLPGEPVRVMARGFPGNDPLAVRVGHTTFALRSREAALIRVSLSQACPV